MSAPVGHSERAVARAFNRQSAVFDELYGRDAIIQYKRERVRTHLLSFAKAGDTILELNCGTGEDALYFAQKGFRVHATDLSSGMLEAFRKKLSACEHRSSISLEQCSFTQLNKLESKGPYDHLFSNFGGLNCTRQLGSVLKSFDALVKPGGTVTLVIISRFCLWELLLLLKGRFRTTTRRFFATRGRVARVEGTAFRCWYYSPAFVRRQMEPHFELLALEGLCSLVPPSYLEQFADKYPRLFSLLKRKEDAWKAAWPWNRMGDYFIITFRKQATLLQLPVNG